MLHGSDSDVVWLQRDFGIYIVNLFDTGQAARVLGFPSAGLAYLLSHFCDVKVSKFPAQHACVSPVLAEKSHVSFLQIGLCFLLQPCRLLSICCSWQESHMYPIGVCIHAGRQALADG